MSWIVVRARSNVKVEHSIRETMDMLNLTRVNHAVIIPENAQYRGMLQKAKDYITWGDADAELVEKMLSGRGRLIGDKPISDADVKEGTEFSNIKEFANAIAADEASMKDMPELKRVFRLHPPRGPKGWGGLKRTYVVGGALGPRGEAISALVERMI
ncbi:MAG TPA: 50S ribosomal protein L30 [Candidatus Poseidoniales archaeon]|jgi:large subunit ribosomal protein L30|nr:MAG: 50S ribosomal protein L30 [Euryarchaeota archaeon]HIF45488.1 50S ribosomal protein L30 [Candidatus Poseidoniales archaeon]HIL64540.1 50S ribosomal protein L30 [Candidatus Poseidoniales archaeon]